MYGKASSKRRGKTASQLKQLKRSIKSQKNDRACRVVAEGEGVVVGDEGCVWWKVREMWGEWRRSGGQACPRVSKNWTKQARPQVSKCGRRRAGKVTERGGGGEEREGRHILLFSAFREGKLCPSLGHAGSGRHHSAPASEGI